MKASVNHVLLNIAVMESVLGAVYHVSNNGVASWRYNNIFIPLADYSCNHESCLYLLEYMYIRHRVRAEIQVPAKRKGIWSVRLRSAFHRVVIKAQGSGHTLEEAAVRACLNY